MIEFGAATSEGIVKTKGYITASEGRGIKVRQ